MIRKPKRPQIGKWNFYFDISRDFQRMYPFTYRVTFMLFKPSKMPTPAAEFKRGEYKGVITCFYIFFPLEIGRWK